MRITPILYSHRPDNGGLCPIVLRITIGKKRIYKPTGERTSPEAWNKTEVRSWFPNAKLINSKIEKLKADLQAEIIKDELQDKAVTPESIRRKFQPKGKKQGMYTYLEKMIASWQGKKKGSTLEKYTHELSKLKAYAPHLEFSDVTPEWLGAYERYQREKLGNLPNTIWRSFKNLKTFFNSAIKEGVIKYYPFLQYDNPKYKGAQRTHLTSREMESFEKTLEEAKLSPADRAAGSFFVFSCLTGLRYSDCLQFDQEKHVIEGKRIYLRTTKTSEDVSILITTRIRKALGAIAGLIIPTNQECNRALKVIAKKADIKKDLTFHSARHTFGFSCADANVPIEVTAKLMGHQNTKVTAVYYHISNSNIDQWITRLHS